MSYLNGPRTITDGLVLALDAGNIKSYPGSGTNWFDLSGNRNTVTLTNGPTYTGSFGGGILFDGIDDTVTVPYSSTLDPTGGITFEAWINPANITTNRYYEIYRKEPGNRILFAFQEYGTILSFGTSTSVNGYSEQDASISAANYTNQVVQVVATYTSGAKVIYRNAIPIDSSTAITGNLLQANATAFIGSIGGGGEFFNGQFFIFKIYSRALSREEIVQNYNAVKGRFRL